MSTVPEIKEGKASPDNPPPPSAALSNSNPQTITTAEEGHQSVIPKQESVSTTTTSSVPEITEHEANPSNPFVPTSSAQALTTEKGKKPDQSANPKQESAKVNPQNGTPKQDSPNSCSQNVVPKQETAKRDPLSDKTPICIPLPALFTPKEKKSQVKDLVGAQDPTTQGKKSPGKELVGVQDSAITYSKDELAKSITADIKYIEDEAKRLEMYKGQVNSQISEASERLDELLKDEDDKDFRGLRDLQKDVTRLKLQIPKQKGDAEEKDTQKDQHARAKKKKIPEKVMKEMPQLYQSSLFKSSLEYKDLEDLFHKLPLVLKLCLLCFSIFPESAIIKKRLMVYWWMAEGFVPPIPRNEEIKQQIANGKTAEEFADEYFEKLTKMGFIEAENKKRSLNVGCYRMHPFIRSALIVLAEKAKFFHFEGGHPTQQFSETFQACLVGRGLIDYDDLRKGRAKLEDLEKLHAVININEPILEFKKEWLLRMKNVNVLYLGRWEASATHHIEVEDEDEKDFLDGLKTMEHLKFLSLQGVSRIMELPESISELSNLMILDIRACHNLESIPEGIGLLKNLTHLDISECYMLEHMPKGLDLLSQLRVFKGFVVGEEQGKHCTLENLAKLKKLIKLSIYTDLRKFPTDDDINALQKFEGLRKLTIAWGGGALQTQSSLSKGSKPDDCGEKKKENPKEKRVKEFAHNQKARRSLLRSYTSKRIIPSGLENLEKLDLKSFPMTTTPSWLLPSRLKSLKKLYIRGGKFSDLGQYQDLDQNSMKHTWKVDILRLKYLTELEMEWRELQELFPDLIYLEKVNCPKLSFFPCDGYGVWINKTKLKQMQDRA